MTPPFDDRSVIRRVGREACVLAGAGRAILLQVAHPGVAQGVADHSRFTEDPLKRLRGTLNYVYGTVFGSAEEAEWVAAVVSRIHSHVVGPGYSADDPDLQLWVAATLYQSAEQVYSLAFGTMPTAMAEELCRQSAVYATALGCPAESWPATLADFDAYWQRQVDSLEVSAEAKRICHELMYAKKLPWYLRLVLPFSRFATAGLLPPRLREAYGFPWNPRRERLFRSAVRLTRLVYRRLPPAVRTLPMRYYLRGLRAQIRTLTPRAPRTDPR